MRGWTSPTADLPNKGAGKSFYTHLQDVLVSTPSFWDPRFHTSPVLGLQDSFFVGGCDTPAMDFLQAQPALLSSQVPVTGFVMKTILGHQYSISSSATGF